MRGNFWILFWVELGFQVYQQHEFAAGGCCRRYSHPVPVTSSKAYRDNVRFAIGIRFTVSPPKESNVLHVWRVILQYGVDWYDKHLFMVSLWVRCPCRICTCLRSWNMVQKFMVLHVFRELSFGPREIQKACLQKVKNMVFDMFATHNILVAKPLG